MHRIGIFITLLVLLNFSCSSLKQARMLNGKWEITAIIINNNPVYDTIMSMEMKIFNEENEIITFLDGDVFLIRTDSGIFEHVYEESKLKSIEFSNTVFVHEFNIKPNRSTGILYSYESDVNDKADGIVEYFKVFKIDGSYFFQIESDTTRAKIDFVDKNLMFLSFPESRRVILKRIN
jgi:hypothetical protein